MSSFKLSDLLSDSYVGAQGTQGTIGLQGTTGSQGTVGAQGVQGITGSQGTIGSQGTVGAQGAIGAQGITGAQGVQGRQGIQGIQGLIGPSTAINATNDSTNAVQFPVFVAAAGSNQTPRVTTSKFTINPSTGKVVIGTTGSLGAGLEVYTSGSTAFDVQGSAGQLFSVTDSLVGVLMSVNDISGIPILEVSSDDTVVMGTFGTNALVVNGSMVGVGTASPTTLLTVNGTATATTFNATSTIRVKKNIRPLVDGISTIKKLKPSMFDRIDLDKNDDIGFIAEEMLQVIPSVVTKDDKDQCIGIDYGRLSAVLTVALLETLNKVEKLEERILSLENKQ